MKTTKIIAILILVSFGLAAQKKNVDGNKIITPDEKQKVMLPNGWSLSPAGRSLELGDLPLNIAVSSTGKLMAVTNNGQGTQSIQLIDPKNEKVVSSIEIPKSFYGLRFSKDEKFLYASGGNDNMILKYAVQNNKLTLKDSLTLGDKWPEKISPVGIEIDDAKNLLYVVTKENNSLYIIDLSTKKILQREALGNEGYTCKLSPDGRQLYISLWGGKKVAIFDTESKKNIFVCFRFIKPQRNHPD